MKRAMTARAPQSSTRSCSSTTSSSVRSPVATARRAAARRSANPGAPTSTGVSGPRRALPAVETVLSALGDLPHGVRAECARAAIDDARERVATGEHLDADAVIADARRRADAMRRGWLHPVVNATGVLVHT